MVNVSDFPLGQISAPTNQYLCINSVLGTALVAGGTVVNKKSPTEMSFHILRGPSSLTLLGQQQGLKRALVRDGEEVRLHGGPISPSALLCG